MPQTQFEIYGSARLITLVRILLLVLAIAVLGVLQGITDDDNLVWLESGQQLRILLLLVVLFTVATAILTQWVQERWHLITLMVFDLLWLAVGAYLTGGVGSPITPLLFAVVLTGNLVMPGPSLLILPICGALSMSAIAGCYLAGIVPFDHGRLATSELLVFAPRVLGNLTVQIAAFFLMHLLGQILSRRLSEQRLVTDELLEQLGEGVLALDRDGRVLYVNHAVAKSLGIENLKVNDNALTLFSQSEREDLNMLWHVVEQGHRPQSIPLQTPDGRQLIVRMQGLVGRRGRLLGTTLLVADETGLRELEQEANRAERLAGLGEMAAGIAHEVRNPLTSLRGCAQEIAAISKQTGVEDVTPLCNILVHESDRLAQLVNDFLDLSRMRQPDEQAVSLPAAVDRVAHLLHGRPEAQRVVVEVDCSEALPALQADPDQLIQVLTNLVWNAVEALAHTDDGRIVIRGSREQHSESGLPIVTITIQDNGPGIPAEKIEKIFTPFFSTKAQGTGLGMTMVQRIVQAHRARIHIDSEVDVGTTVTLHWPAIPHFES